MELEYWEGKDQKINRRRPEVKKMGHMVPQGNQCAPFDIDSMSRKKQPRYATTRVECGVSF
jgi:hypothetical protein